MNYLYTKLNLNKKKERFEIILEPLQAVLQLAFLSTAPIDTKINIYNNILYIQPPNWKQSISRTYYNDSKNDLFYLFSAISRFNKFYNHLSNINGYDTDLYSILSEMAQKGIDNLLQTYKQTDNPALLHTLVIYKNILHSDSNNGAETSGTTAQNTKIDNFEGFNMDGATSSTANNIDDVFINIRKIYSENDLNIIFNTLLLIKTNPQNYLDYIVGLNYILEPINKQIKNWISDNIVY